MIIITLNHFQIKYLHFSNIIPHYLNKHVYLPADFHFCILQLEDDLCSSDHFHVHFDLSSRHLDLWYQYFYYSKEKTTLYHIT